MSLKFSVEEVTKHNNAEDLWIVIHGKVCNVTKFLTEHPGGEEVLLALAGQNATKCFDDIGHSEEAIQLKDTYVIGDLDGTMPIAESPAIKKQESQGGGNQATVDDDDWVYEEPKKESSPYKPLFVALAVLVYAVLFYYIFLGN